MMQIWLGTIEQIASLARASEMQKYWQEHRDAPKGLLSAGLVDEHDKATTINRPDLPSGAPSGGDVSPLVVEVTGGFLVQVKGVGHIAGQQVCWLILRLHDGQEFSWPYSGGTGSRGRIDRLDVDWTLPVCVGTPAFDVDRAVSLESVIGRVG